MKTPGNKAKATVAFADFISEEGSVRRRGIKTSALTPSRTQINVSPFVDKTPSTAVQNIITLAMASGRVSDRKKRGNGIDLQQLSNNSPSTEVLPRRARRGSRLF